jgi:hypothetical protein
MPEVPQWLGQKRSDFSNTKNVSMGNIRTIEAKEHACQEFLDIPMNSPWRLSDASTTGFNANALAYVAPL